MSVRPDYALFADSPPLSKAGPAAYGLSAGEVFEIRPAPPEFTLIADRKPAPARAKTKRLLYGALAAAVAFHLLVLGLFLARGGPSKRLGVEEGLPETLNVSMISDADLKRISSDPFRQEAPPPQAEPREAPAPPEEPPAPPAPRQPTPRQPEPKEASAAPAKPAADRIQRPYDPSSFIAMASDQFSSELKQAVTAAEARRQTPRQSATMASANVKVFRPGASHTGQSDEFARAVIWALGATRPMGNGKWGSSVVTFTVSASGQVDGLRLIKSSGDNFLDQGALLAVRQARMPVPPPALPAGDRSFNIEYISLPGR